MAKHFPKCANDKDPLNSIRLVESWDCNPVVDYLRSIHKTMAIARNTNMRRKLNKEILTHKPSS